MRAREREEETLVTWSFSAPSLLRAGSAVVNAPPSRCPTWLRLRAMRAITRVGGRRGRQFWGRGRARASQAMMMVAQGRCVVGLARPPAAARFQESLTEELRADVGVGVDQRVLATMDVCAVAFRLSFGGASRVGQEEERERGAVTKSSPARLRQSAFPPSFHNPTTKRPTTLHRSTSATRREKPIA
jgi:hypothetical protein